MTAKSNCPHACGVLVGQRVSLHVQCSHRTYKRCGVQKANGLGMLAMSIDRQESAVAAFVKSSGYNFPAGMATVEVAKMLPKPRGLPVVVVFEIGQCRMTRGQGCFCRGRGNVPGRY